MAQGSIFDSETKEKSSVKTWIIAVGALLIFVGVGAFLVWYTQPVGRPYEDILAEKIRDNTILMLQYRTFSGDEFRKQVLGNGHFWRYIKATDEAFFTYPPDDDQGFSDFITKYFYDPAKVEFAKEVNGRLWVGDYDYPITPSSGHFFRTSLANIHIDPNQTLTFPYADVNYTISLEEMHDFLDGSEVYGGDMFTLEPERTNRPMMFFANHGIAVAKPGEPTLKRLTDALLKDVGPSREARIQRLVDFVSYDIDYSYTEAVGTYETIKRASETLMTRNGDCSNKTILLASLLEEIDEPYLLLYCPRHITVAVPQGAFSSENKLDLTWDGKPWVITETTLPGFQVGTTKVNDAARLQTVRYVQDPKHMNVIIDASSYEVLKYF